jgi:hypothetical protein
MKRPNPYTLFILNHVKTGSFVKESHQKSPTFGHKYEEK